jgi:hypothetical protein
MNYHHVCDDVIVDSRGPFLSSLQAFDRHTCFRRPHDRSYGQRNVMDARPAERRRRTTVLTHCHLARLYHQDVVWDTRHHFRFGTVWRALGPLLDMTKP